MHKGRTMLLALVGALLLSAVALTGTAAAQTYAPQGYMGSSYYNWGGGDHMMMGPVATLLKMTPQELAAQLATGKTVFQVAAEKGVSKQAVLDAAVAPYADMLALRVKYGYITQQQADQLVAQDRESLRIAFSTAGAGSGYGYGGAHGYGCWDCGTWGGPYQGNTSNPNQLSTGNTYRDNYVGSNQGASGSWGMGRNGGTRSGGGGMGAGRGGCW